LRYLYYGNSRRILTADGPGIIADKVHEQPQIGGFSPLSERSLDRIRFQPGHV